MIHGMHISMIGLCVTALLLAPAVFYGGPWILRQVRMNRIRGVVTRERLLILTYDDGPSEELTPRLLDLLSRRRARATFFMQGSTANRFPEIVDRIVREGHAVGCHSDRHLNAWAASSAAAVADIDDGYSNLSRWIPPDAVFRPPYGKMTFATWWWAHRHRVPVVWWTVDSGDTHRDLPNSAQIAEAVRRAGGGIVLMHDFDHVHPRNDFVLELTSALLDLAERESLRILPLTELCPL
jgi:peptidoglycan/xylan/chitin deacetylase (PgdA/CDA1 family)